MATCMHMARKTAGQHGEQLREKPLMKNLDQCRAGTGSRDSTLVDIRNTFHLSSCSGQVYASKTAVLTGLEDCFPSPQDDAMPHHHITLRPVTKTTRTEDAGTEEMSTPFTKT
ncbi:hypothetical protein Y1Q_0022011 [Alligator mississippiensis]|uniref:Uncharacterized protein n=1 Tax=Alligator mississippiensis TaxID=8496 RepID=A0A151NLP7_ALLMI|nr:hypothetical protein Y1Q_0022011 [Alligator mississippiensis]